MNYQTNDGQQLFDYNVKGITVSGILFCIFVMYFPLVFTAFAIDTELLHHKSPDFKQLRDILLIAAGIYLLLYFVKGFMLYCKGRGYWIWLPLFLLCVGFTSFVPGLVFYRMIHTHVQQPYSILLAIAVGYFLYLPYRFLSDTPAGLARPFYNWGIDIGDACYKAFHK